MPKFYDVNLNSTYPITKLFELEKNDVAGYCINKIIKPKELNGLSKSKMNYELNKGIYSRIEVDFSSIENISYDTKKHLLYDLFVIKINDTSNIDKIIKYSPDMVRFDLISVLHAFKHKLIRTLVKEKIFIEIVIKDGLSDENRELWMKNIRRLLAICKGKNVVFSSGASDPSELKTADEIYRLVKMFGIKHRRALEMLQNPEKLLHLCAIKRHTYKNMIFNTNDEGSLKKDFLIKQYEYCVEK